jgi:hypothetical protein
LQNPTKTSQSPASAITDSPARKAELSCGLAAPSETNPLQPQYGNFGLENQNFVEFTRFPTIFFKKFSGHMKKKSA